MKKLFLSIILILASFSIFAKNGPMIGEKNLRVVKTQWFDIIYPERSEKTASILYQNVDKIYYEVTEQYGLEPVERFPLVIVPGVESLNAFWNSIPYGHIVLYDTSLEGFNELSVFSDTLLSIFRHELTHAVTFTMKNKFWRGWANIFGEITLPGPMLVTTGMAEGATVTSESASGEGRLNDEYAKHSVKQAKIEGEFPSYYGVQGAGELNPYFFNGAFHEWLQKNYGIERYAKFWYYTINFQGLTTAKRFKKAFGEKLTVAWSKFIQDYEVPNISSDPVTSNEVKDFFVPSENKYSRKNNAGSYYKCLNSSNNSLYWIDGATSSVYTTSKNAINDENIKTPYKKMFTQAGIYNVTPSWDDKYLAVSLYSNNSPTVKARVKIYDTQTKQDFLVKETGLKDGAIIKNNGEYYLVASKFVAPNNSIQIYKILTKENGRIQNVEKIKEIILPYEEYTSSYIPFEDGFAYVKKDELKFSICISDIDGVVLQEFDAPQERMVIHSLSLGEEDSAFGKKNLHFSWTKKGTMPRDGVLLVNAGGNEVEGEFKLSNKDISGGIFNPIVVNGDIIYSGHFLYQYRLLSFTPNLNDYESFKANPILLGESENSSITNHTVTDELFSNTSEFQKTDFALSQSEFPLPPSQKFNSFDYYKKGVFLPVYLNTLEYLSFEAGIYPIVLSFGATYITANPWSKGVDFLIFSGGYNAYYNNFDFDFVANFGTDTSLFYSTTDFSTRFSLKGWERSRIGFMANSNFNFGNISTFSVQNSIEAAIYRDTNYSAQDTFTLSYSNIHNKGAGDYELGGFAVSFGGNCLINGFINSPFDVPEEKENTDIFQYDLFVNISARVPRLLPFESSYGLTTNLPSYIGLDIFPIEVNENSNSIMRFTGETILFAQYIKEPLAFIKGIFVQNWNILFGYQGDICVYPDNAYSYAQFLHIGDYYSQIKNNDFNYNDKLYLKIACNFSPNIGRFSSNNMQGSLYTKVIYNLKPKKDYSPIKFDIGFELNL